MTIGSANGNDVGAIAGAADCAVGQLVNRRAVSVVAGDDVGAAEIAGAANNYDARSNCDLNCLAKRIRVKGFAHWHAQAEVGNADVVACAVLNHPVDGRQYIARAANTVLVENANINQVGAGSNTGVVCCIAAGGCAAPCCYTGYAGSMAISIAAALAAAKIDGRDDTRLIIRYEVRVICTDATVENCDSYPFAVDARGSWLIRLHLRHARRIVSQI